MKHKGLLIATTILIFTAIVVVCLLSLLRITDVTVEYKILNTNALYGDITDHLQKYERKNLLFLKKDDVKNDLESYIASLENGGYLKISEIEKKYPNRLTVSLEERVEVFAVSFGGGYYMLDDDYFVMTKKANNVNREDGVNNIVLDLNLQSFNEQALKIGEYFSLKDNDGLIAMDKLYRKFDDCRNVVTKIYIEEKNEHGNYYVYFTMKEGVTIEIPKAVSDGERVIDSAIAYYTSLSDLEKSYGYVRAYLSSKGEVTVRHTENL